MKVTSVRLTYPKDTSGKLKAFAKVALDEQLLISGIRIIVTPEKRFLQFPERKIDRNITEGAEVNIPIVHPIRNDLREHITDEVFAVYDEEQANAE